MKRALRGGGLAPLFASGLMAMSLAACSQGTPQPVAPSPPVPRALPISMLDMMRASVEIPSSGLWAIQSAEKLSDEDWLLVDQDAADLAASTTLMSMPGAGKNDAAWVANADWQAWTAEVRNTALEARAAGEAKDQARLSTALDHLTEVCQACHDKYRPEIPSDGVARYPFYPPRALSE